MGMKQLSLRKVETKVQVKNKCNVRLMNAESRAIRSTDLWDAGTDSRFRSGDGTAKKRR